MRKVRKWLANPHLSEIQEKIDKLTQAQDQNFESIKNYLNTFTEYFREMEDNFDEMQMQLDHLESQVEKSSSLCPEPKPKRGKKSS